MAGIIPLLVTTRGHVPERSPLALASDGYLTLYVEHGGGGQSEFPQPTFHVRRRKPEKDELLEQRLREDEIILAVIINAVTRNML